MNSEFPVLLGMPEQDAYRILAQRKALYRVAKRNGKFFKITSESNPNRVNLYIEDGLVIKYEFF